MPRLCLSLLLSLLFASSASAVTMAWTPVGSPGNACDPQSQGCFGAIPYAYAIGTYEVTNAQYAEFLNAVAADDTHALYNTSMDVAVFDGGIHRTGSAGSYQYNAIAGRENHPVNWVTYFDALRFVNWLDNGQPVGPQNAATTEDGSYTFTGLETNAGRNPSAIIVLASESEWYKAAYYDSVAAHYWDYPTGTNTAPICLAPTATPNAASCDGPGTDAADVDIDHPAPVGSYPGAPGPFGTFDQGGNVGEWVESLEVGDGRVNRGGNYELGPSSTGAANRAGISLGGAERSGLGFRVAMIPEPGTGLLVIAGLLGLAGWRRGSA